VNVYFCRGLSGKDQRRLTCQIDIETKRLQITFLESRRLEKATLQRWRPSGLTGGAPAPTSWAAALATEPIRSDLVDPASTAFEDE
jgi:hypothetical protein